MSIVLIQTLQRLIGTDSVEKAGFVQIGRDKGFASARQEEIEEYIY
ncbi:hypothetical protein ACX3PU_05710 [Chryseobacterium sp. A301]